ncbi:MAG: SMR family transporter [Enterococcus hirae]|nr:SMR family transporter [Enterococcus hirae]
MFTGIGAVGTIIFGILFLNESVSVQKILFSAASSLLLLSHSMNTLEAGVSYSIWVAFGSIGSMILGVFLFKEKMNWLQFASMIIILFSVIGLKLVS